MEKNKVLLYGTRHHANKHSPISKLEQKELLGYQPCLSLALPWPLRLGPQSTGYVSSNSYSTVQSLAKDWLCSSLAPAWYVIDVENVGTTGRSTRLQIPPKRQPHHGA